MLSRRQISPMTFYHSSGLNIVFSVQWPYSIPQPLSSNGYQQLLSTHIFILVRKYLDLVCSGTWSKMINHCLVLWSAKPWGTNPKWICAGVSWTWSLDQRHLITVRLGLNFAANQTEKPLSYTGFPIWENLRARKAVHQIAKVSSTFRSLHFVGFLV